LDGSSLPLRAAAARVGKGRGYGYHEPHDGVGQQEGRVRGDDGKWD